jgi:serine/threonine protein kinase/tetratricopeptide (TPR) repeat protein
MNERTVFLEALDIADASARRAFLDRRCAGDAVLRRQVEELLAAHERPGSFLDSPLAGPAVTAAQPAGAREGAAQEQEASGGGEGPGVRIGPYKLLQQIGEGGMGVVYMAEQEQPVRRKVALKIIKPGMDSQQVLARFEAERQALAMMDHQNIARVLDAGATECGRPYFVMELVHGVPITQFCDDGRLTPRERLDLFVPVCQAVQHAHQKGVIHRDVKPSNVLVTMYDDKPVPKVIDFGVAKAVEQRLTERTLFTQFGALVGTFEYMSPEQAEMNAFGVDTRSDIYSLGVLLYELLTGTTPLERKRLREAALSEVVRLIKEEEPPRPSARLSSSDTLAKIAAARKTEPARLSRLVCGEIDWIVMKCLEKDRSRRYETANGLARDVERYLHDEPVEAGPPSATYRLRKFAYRYRTALGTVTAFALLLIAAVVVSTWQAVRATRAEDQARTAATEADLARQAATTERDQAVRAKEDAKRSEEDAKAVLKYFQDTVLAAGRPLGYEGGLGKDVTLRQAVDATEPAVAKAFVDRPLVEASIRHTLGTTYWYLGENALAIAQHERALALREAQLGAEDLSTVLAREGLADAFWSAGRPADAIPLHEQGLKQLEAQLGPDHRETLTCRNNLALAYADAGRTADALRILKQTLEQREARFGPDDPATLVSRNCLADVYMTTGRLAEALRLHEPNLKLAEARLGADHPDTLNYRNNLAQTYKFAGRHAEALPLQERNLKLSEAKLGAVHPNTLSARNNLADTYWSLRRLDRSVPLFEEVLRLRKDKLGLDHVETLRTMANLGINYRDAGRPLDGIPLLETALERARARPGGIPAQIAWIPARLAEAYDQVGQFAKSEELVRASLDQARRQFGADDLRVAAQAATLGLNLLRQHKPAEAEPILRECLAIRTQKQPDEWTTFNARSMLGEALVGQKNFAGAEPLLLAGYQGLKERQAAIPQNSRVRLTEALERLVQLYDAWGKQDDAARWRKALEAGKAAKQP